MMKSSSTYNNYLSLVIVVLLCFLCLNICNIRFTSARIIKGYKNPNNVNGSNAVTIKKCNFALELLYMQDTSEDFDDQLRMITDQFEQLMNEIEHLYPDTTFGLSGFNDKTFNEKHDGYDVCLESLAPVGSPKEMIMEKMKSMKAQGGNDIGENYLGAMIRAALSTKTRWSLSGYKLKKKQTSTMTDAPPQRRNLMKGKKDDDKDDDDKDDDSSKWPILIASGNSTQIAHMKGMKTRQLKAKREIKKRDLFLVRFSAPPSEKAKAKERVKTVKVIVMPTNAFAHWNPIFGRNYQMSLWDDVVKPKLDFSAVMKNKRSLMNDENALCIESDYPTLTQWGDVMRNKKVIPLVLATDWTGVDFDYEYLDIATKLGEDAWLDSSKGLVAHWESLMNWADLDGMVAPVEFKMTNFTEAVLKELKYSLPELVC